MTDRINYQPNAQSISKEWSYTAKLEIIGINPFVFVPRKILQEIFKQAGTDKSPIPIQGEINGKAYKQTLMKYRGEWRLYVNLIMLDNSPKRIGESLAISVQFDPESREIQAPLGFVKALKSYPVAKAVFDDLSPSKKSEIIRYLARLKTEEALERNISRAIRFLLGNERFLGRDKP